MPTKVAAQAARWIGLVVALIGLLGFVNNPYIGSGAAIEADLIQNIAHVVLGIYLFGVSFAGESASAFSLYMAAILCMLFAGLTYHELGSFQRGELWNTMWANRAGAYLHGGMAVVMVLCAKMNTSSKQLLYN
jgi:hypothetical protein